RAGGLRPDADPAAINLAERLKDGEEVVAPVLGAPTRYPSRRRTATRTTRADKKEPAAIVNVNTATAADLATIPGIGKTLAARIVEVRGRDGAFATLDELLDVAGMTPARLDRASQYLEI
ncbi:MAG TPA: helix-hairpin-helix domain-containing protein, partial [Candidatus Aquilonibacter sp.]|nr:helix-hairpin-helix domain-containing protein [Candidatus Aquilonibacter sp.]